MDDAYALRYQDLYENHWWWRTRELFLLHQLRSIRPTGGFNRILDVGCGNGLFFDQLREFGDPEGIEENGEIVTEAGQMRGPIHIGAFNKGFRPKVGYGLILMLDVLEHLSEPEKSVAHAASLLQDGGVLMITVPAFNCLWTAHDDFNEHVTRYRRRALLDIVHPSGLNLAKCQYFCHWLFPLKLLVRMAESLAPGKGKREMTSVPAKPLNDLMSSICRLEQLVFKRFPLPFGSSLFGLFRRNSA